jgi:hypothetical protein
MLTDEKRFVGLDGDGFGIDVGGNDEHLHRAIDGVA